MAVSGGNGGSVNLYSSRPMRHTLSKLSGQLASRTSHLMIVDVFCTPILY